MFAKRLALAFAIGLALLGARPIGIAAAPASTSTTVCLDSSSPSYRLDASVAKDLAKYGDPLTPFVFDGGQGVSERFFRYLSMTKCAVIMGYPVDLKEPDPPDGLALTQPYLTTAYVLASPTKRTQASLRPGNTIAVGMGTAPHFFLAGAFGPVPNYTINTYQTQEQVLGALAAGQATVAMAWEPSIVRFAQTHPAAKGWFLSPLDMQHTTWKVAALYPEGRNATATRFNMALAKMKASGELARLTKPYDWKNGSR